MAVTKTDIVNLASTHLGERRYTDPFTDTSPTAELLSFRYDFSRKEVLRSHTWGCAKKDVSLSEDATAPEHTWSKRFLVPQESLRLVNIANTDLNDLHYKEYELKGQYIHTDLAAPLKITYIRDEDDTSLFDSMLTESIALHLAASCSIAITDDKGLSQGLFNLYDKKVEEAKFTDSLQRRRPVDNMYTYSAWDSLHQGGE
jgi:hypothetical protein|tara:strand:+ start:248 stop:850 length:603 start_codon:yes stop_codon:yes gene_type:complete